VTATPAWVTSDHATRALKQFRDWLESDDPASPATRVYWTGWLAEQMADCREVRELANAVLYASGALPHPRRTGPGNSGQIIQPPAGPALVELSQRRLGPGQYEYRARRLPRRCREDTGR
jgi:hypothetical protein